MIVLAAILVLSLQAAGAEEAAAAYLASAQEAIKSHNIQLAKKQIGLAIDANPRLSEAWLMLAGIEFQNGELGAIEHYQRALQLAPNSFAGHYDLALAYLRERRLLQARRELERAVSLNPKHPGAAYNLGMILLELDNPREAVKFFQQAKTLEPRQPDVAFNLIRAQLAAGDFTGARASVQQDSASFAEDPEWQGSIGHLFLEAGQSEDAIAHLEAALHLPGAADETRSFLGSAYLQSRQPDRVLQVIPEPRSAEDYFLRSSALFEMHQLSEAEAEVGRALEEKPQEQSYLMLAARIRQSAGQQEQALEILKQVIKNAPQSAEPHYSMAVSYYFEHRYEDARGSLEQSLRRNPRSPHSLFLYAVTLVNQGRNREAQDYLRRAINLQPGNARYHFHLGTAFIRDNRPVEARSSFEEAIRLQPDYALAHYELGKLLAKSGHQEAAARELEKAIQVKPDLAQAYYQLARVTAALGQNSRSSEALATFNSLKKRDEDPDLTLAEDVNGELRHP